MTGKEALRILNKITTIHNFLMKGNDRSAFFDIGRLTEELAQIVRIDQFSFNPTVKEEEL
jgi:hypothetical protein